jgi:hypothetical protein
LNVKVARHDYILTPDELRWSPTVPARLRESLVSFRLEDRGDIESENAKVRARRRFARWRQFLATTEAIDDFNRDIVQDLDPAVLSAQVQNKDAALGSLTGQGRLPPDFLRLIWLRESAESLARKLDALFLLWQRALFIMLFFSVTCFDLYDHHAVFGRELNNDGRYNYLLWGFSGGVVLCVGIAARAWYARLYERRLDYRALAETVRVRIYWAIAGVGLSVADSYLGQLSGEISWARLALKISAPPPSQWQEYFQRQSPDNQFEQLCLVEKEWVADQASFYRRTFEKRHKAATWYRFSGLCIAFGGVLIAVGLASFSRAEHPGVLIAVNMSVLVAALLLLYSDRQSHEDLAKQYERMTEVFSKGAADLKTYLHGDSVQIAAAQETIIALGHEAISEHSQWLILRRNRPFEVPVP